MKSKTHCLLEQEIAAWNKRKKLQPYDVGYIRISKTIMPMPDRNAFFLMRSIGVTNTRPTSGNLTRVHKHGVWWESILGPRGTSATACRQTLAGMRCAFRAARQAERSYEEERRMNDMPYDDPST